MGTKRRTHEEYVEQLRDKNPDVILLEKYYGNKKKILHKCLICKHEWAVMPESLLFGYGCPNCATNNRANKRRKTQSMFIDELKNINPNIEVLGTYVNYHTKINVKCTLCKHKWNVVPSSLLSGTGCPICANQLLGEKFRKNHNQFVDEMKNINDSIKILGKYETAAKKVLCKCLVCNNQWKAAPNKLLGGRGCPECAIRKRNNSKIIDYDKVINDINNSNININVIGKYEKKSVPILCKCRDCGHEWKPFLYNLINNKSGCPECARLRSMKTNDEFLQELQEVTSVIKPLENYIGIANKIKVKCLREECKHTWMTTPSSLLRGHGCPKCNSSLGEIKILNYLKNNKIVHKWQITFDGLVGLGGGLLSYDFYLPTHNLLIEYQGEFHDGTAKQMTEEDFTYRKEHDNRKRNYAKNNNIDLLEIWYWDFANVETILSNKLAINNINIAS